MNNNAFSSNFSFIRTQCALEKTHFNKNKIELINYLL